MPRHHPPSFHWLCVQALRDGHAAPGPAGAGESAIAVGAAKEAHEVGSSEHSLQVCTLCLLFAVSLGLCYIGAL